MKAVNLLPPDQRTKSLRVKPTKKGLVGVGMVAAFAGVGYWGFSIHQSIGAAQRDLADAQSEQAQLTAQVGSYAAAEARAAEQQRAQGLVIGLANARVNWERIVRDAATVMPRQTWLTALRAQSPGIGATATAAATTAPAPTPASTSTTSSTTSGSSSGSTGTTTPAATPVATADDANSGLHLDGYAMNQRQIALLMVRLGAVAGLGEPKLSSSTAEALGGRRVVKFTVDVPVDQRAQDRPTLTAGIVPTSTTPQP
jgi:Tfp pilus assembly protein PilN